MINVTDRLEAVNHHAASGITWVKLKGGEGFDWCVTRHPETPDGFVCIGGASNSSFRLIEKAALAKHSKGE